MKYFEKCERGSYCYYRALINGTEYRVYPTGINVLPYALYKCPAGGVGLIKGDVLKVGKSIEKFEELLELKEEL